MPLVCMIKGAQDWPTFVCDWCRKPITKAEDGNYSFDYEKDANGRYSDGLKAVLYFTHKECFHAFETANPNVSTYVNDIELLFAYLVNSMGVDMDRAQRRAEFLDRIEI